MRYDVTFVVLGHKKISVCAKNKKAAEKAASEILDEHIVQDAFVDRTKESFRGIIECVPSKEKK